MGGSQFFAILFGCFYGRPLREFASLMSILRILRAKEIEGIASELFLNVCVIMLKG